MRRILHIDMDAFYASVEQRDDPSLRGKPLAVGGQPNRRGVVAAASYEARAFGVRSAMSMAKAVKLCPSLVIVPPDFSRYKAASTTIFDIYREVTPLVEPLSLDEAYLDVTENSWNEPLATTVAKRLKERIREATGLTASAGVAPNKFLAKIASGWKKPDGLTVIAPDRVEPFLQRLPVDALWGVGPVTAKRLRARGISRLVDVRAIDEQALREAVGSMADWLRQLANGIDDRPVVADSEPKSSGSENTYPEDLTDIDTIRAEIGRDGAPRRRLARAARSARAHGDDQGSLLGLHDDHPQPHGRAEPRCGEICRRGPCNYCRKLRRANGRSGCLASASTISVRRLTYQTESDEWLPFAEIDWPGDCTKSVREGDMMLDRMEPLRSGRDTEIDMIEREMEGGVVVIQPPDVHEHAANVRLGGLVRVEEDVECHELKLSLRWLPKREISVHARFAQQDDLPRVHARNVRPRGKSLRAPSRHNPESAAGSIDRPGRRRSSLHRPAARRPLRRLRNSAAGMFLRSSNSRWRCRSNGSGRRRRRSTS